MTHILVFYDDETDSSGKEALPALLESRFQDVTAQSQFFNAATCLDLVDEHQPDGVLFSIAKTFPDVQIVTILKRCPVVAYCFDTAGLRDFREGLAIHDDLEPFELFAMPSYNPHIVDRLMELIEQS